jgi:5'-3' exonuclease
MSKILTIDGNNLVHRVYYVANNMPHKSEHLHVYMFLNSVKSYVEMYQPDKVYCVWDEKLNYVPNKRLELLPDYKGTRDKEKGREVHTKNDLIKELLQSIGIPSIFPLEYEADDVIAIIDDTVLHDKHTIITVDRDLCQLITDKTVVYDAIRKLEINESNFEEKLKYNKEQFVRVKAITGDKSDNIPGIKGFGKKKIEKYFNNEVDFTEDERIIFERNLELVTLVNSGDEAENVKKQLNECSFKTDWDLFKQKAEELDFKNIIKNDSVWYSTFFQTNRLLELLA